MKVWKNMKTWQKVLAVLFVLFLIRACSSATKDPEQEARHTTTAQAVAAESNKPDPTPAFLVEQKDKGVIMRFECANPNVKGSGFNFVYRDYAGNILDNSGYKTYWSITSADSVGPIPSTEWLTMEGTPTGKYPKPDAFLLAMWEMRDTLNSKTHPAKVVFTIAKSTSEASRSTPMEFSGPTLVYIAASANSNPCFVLAGK